jgi:dipeptidyl aminopeptidase/acylaminoacyl peptidase
MHRQLALAILLLSAVLPALPQTNLYALESSSEIPSASEAMGQGEIGLRGTILSVGADRRSFSLKASSFILPNGKSGNLTPAKQKQVTLDKRTAIYTGRGTDRKVTPTELRGGKTVEVIGSDLGSGKPLPARSIHIYASQNGHHVNLTGRFDQPSAKVPSSVPVPDEPETELGRARAGFQTTITTKPDKPGEAPDVPPAEIFKTVRYASNVGDLQAYLSPDPGDGKRHPAIIWITGGDCNSIGDVWSPHKRSNDQTAAPYRQAGIIMMFPALRGGNDNPGIKEGFLGEVDDVIAAARFLEKQPYVDPKKIYLGGHSTGGTLALLVAECTARFRNVFAFGPVDDVAGYGPNSGFLPFDIKNEQEVKLRSPIHWLASIQSPVWIIEGTKRPGNYYSLWQMERKCLNSHVHFLKVEDTDHFSVLAPANEVIASKILRDAGAESNIFVTESQIANRLFVQPSQEATP